MRLRILSDLHLEEAPWSWQPAGEDLCILAGDIVNQNPSSQPHFAQFWCAIAESGIPTLYVLGNHEGYDDWVPRDELRQRIQATLPANVRLLDRDAVDCGGIRFLGCTLWTSFASVTGVTRLGKPIDRLMAMRAARFGIPDFTFLCVDRQAGRPIVRAEPDDLADWHEQDRAWLNQEIARADRPVVVITHFLPGPGSIAPEHVGSILSPYFCTDCRDLLRPPVRLWIHGHTHASCDYQEGLVRVVCNPRGAQRKSRMGNQRFDASMLVEV